MNNWFRHGIYLFQKGNNDILLIQTLNIRFRILSHYDIWCRMSPDYTLCMNCFIAKGTEITLNYRDINMKNIALSLTMLFGLIGSAQALDGDAEAGKTKAAACAACHGSDGNSELTIYPKIAGQHADYLFKQVKDFKVGMETNGDQGRMNAIMGGMVMPLSDQDMKDISAYFASQTTKSGSTPENVIEAGQALFRGGDMERGIPACQACHGPRGVGQSLAGFPQISFQHADYTKSQLEAFRSGERNNDMNKMMRDIASKLTDKDIEIISKYLGGLH